MKGHQGHGLKIPSDLKLVLSVPLNSFESNLKPQPGSQWLQTPKVSHSHMQHPRDSSWHLYTEEYIDYFWLQKFWPPEIQTMFNLVTILWECLLSWLSQYLLRSPFWQNFYSLVWMGSHSGSNSHRRSKFPDKKNSSGLLEMNLIMQYPHQDETANLQEIPLPSLTDPLSPESSSNTLSREVQ